MRLADHNSSGTITACTHIFHGTEMLFWWPSVWAAFRGGAGHFAFLCTLPLLMVCTVAGSYPKAGYLPRSWSTPRQ